MDLSVIVGNASKTEFCCVRDKAKPGSNMVSYPGQKFKVLGAFPACFCCVRHLGGINMSFLQKIRLIFECFRLAGGFGLIAGVKNCLGILHVQENDLESSVFGGVSLE